MEELTELGFIGTADYIDFQDDWRNPEWKILNREFFSVVVDDVLDFLNEYYLPL
jgi:hypothetical protein